MYESSVTNAVIGIIAPARNCTTGTHFEAVDQQRISTACEAFRRQGWLVKEASNLYGLHQRFAGTDRQRAEGVMQIFSDTDVDLVLSVRGGYGTARILPLIDWDLMRASRAVLMGLSDITALNLALLAKCGRASWQGPVAGWFAQENLGRDRAFVRAMTEPDFYLETSAFGDEVEVDGVIWGGNLTVLTSLVGTEYFPEIDDGILFIEDIAEPAWRIERMLDQLVNNGILARQKLIVVGEMIGAEVAEGRGQGRFTLGDALGYIQEKTGLPIIQGLHFGHVPDTLVLPVGVEANVRLQGEKLTIYTGNAPVPTCVPWLETARHALWWM